MPIFSPGWNAATAAAAALCEEHFESRWRDGARSGVHFKKSVPVHYSANCTNRTRWLRRNRNCCRRVGKDAVRTEQTLSLGAREFWGVLEFVGARISCSRYKGHSTSGVNGISVRSRWVPSTGYAQSFSRVDDNGNRTQIVRGPSNEVQTSRANIGRPKINEGVWIAYNFFIIIFYFFSFQYFVKKTWGI